ncbi:TRAP transporter large permease [Amorphus sp. 3PC139-8]|uniref:TRAP transporter large permease n=1 Tax=Amorphus sp. 3PC139-8 TaxID=2735676 RepID=UPI00345DD90B
MDPLLLGLLIVSLVLVMGGFQVAFALGACAFFYLIVNDFPLSLAAQEMALSLDKFTFMAIPLFMLAGMLMNLGGITPRIFRFANLAVGRIPGGLGHVNIAASLIFAGMSGSVLADVAGLGPMQLKTMKENGYKTDFAIGITLASSAIGPILPPSVPMVLFAVIAEVSVVGMFLGGVLPAFLIAGLLMCYVYIVGKREGYFTTAWGGWRALAGAFVVALPALLTPVIIVGGMTFGVFSPTEAAAAAVLYAFFIAAVIYRDLPWREVPQLFRSVAISATKLLFVITTALLFGWVLTVGQMTQDVASYLGETFESGWLFLLVLIIVLLVLGAVIENAILLLILAPMLLPIAVSNYGFDPIHLGVVMVFAIMLGQYTPPMGLSLFIIRDLTGLSLVRVSVAVLPFLIPLIAALLIMAYVPALTLWLPHLAGFGQ